MRTFWKERGIVWAIRGAAFFLVAYAWLSTEVSAPNERSRIYLTLAMVDHQEVSIDEPVARFGRIFDRAEREGRLYSDKAPGSSLLGAAVYGTARLLTSAEDWSIQGLLLLMRFGLMIPLTALGYFFLLRILRSLGLDPPTAELAAMGWLLATPVLHYGQAFYGHQIVAVALLGAVYFLLREERGRQAFLGAGAMAGVAGLTEYQAAIPAVLIALWALYLAREGGGMKALLAFGAGAAPFLILLLGYHWLAFGGPFELSYHHLEDARLDEHHTQGIGGVLLPTLEGIWGSFFSLHRGLFATAPIFLFGLVGFAAMKRRISGDAFWALAAMLIYFALFIVSSNTWFGGWSYGPRLLVPAMGLLMIPAAFGLEAIRGRPIQEGLAMGALMVGMVSNLAMKMTFFEAPPELRNPLVSVAFAAMERGWSAPSLLTVLGGSPGITAAAGFLIGFAALGGAWFRYARSDWRHWALGGALAFVILAGIFAFGESNQVRGERFLGTMERTLEGN